MRVIGPDGGQLGILDTHEARRLAENEGLDLVEISPTAKPPVCKIMDYGKYKYELDKKKQEAKKHQTVVQIKEVKVRPSTDKHDLETKIKHIRRFIQDGNKAKITVKFRGRELAHRELGMDILQKLIQEVAEIAKVDAEPKFEGKMLSAILAPKPGGSKNAKTENK